MRSPELSWLPLPPSDWSNILQSVTAPGVEAWELLVHLAQFRLDELMTIRLDRRLQRVLGTAPPPNLGAAPVRMAVLGSSTMEHLLPGLRVGALRRGIPLALYTGAYGQYATELADPVGDLHAFRPDLVLFAFDAGHLTAGLSRAGSVAEASACLDQVASDLAGYWRQARARGWGVLQQTLLPGFPSLLGSNEHRLPGSRAAACERLNHRLRDMADAEGVDLLAVDLRAARDGIPAWHDPVMWHRAKQDVHPGAVPVYGDLVGRILAARQGRSRKALVLDLDNTLWGGVIGDDGLEGIVLGQGSALGETYVEFQNYARALSHRGIILAVCSKNTEAIAFEPFDRHPEMVLKRSDIACFIANWTDKAANLREIARRLNIGLDALVFVDDNPAERSIIRRELPMVAVPELPEDPSGYAQCVSDGGYFESVTLTAEDVERSRQYQANLERESVRASTTDMDGYLRSLDMELRWSRFDALGATRIVQLVNKTNQFNLTTRRTTAEAVAAIIADPGALSLQARLLDQFGDNGIIAIVHGHRRGIDLVIDTWLMSCRVLGRGVEQATLNLVASEAQRLGASRLVGEYRPSAKNDMVREHYPKLGFTPLDAPDKAGVARYALDLTAFAPQHVHMRIVEV